jgi:hypothetical protein
MSDNRDQERLYMLTHIHTVLVKAGELPEGVRPPSLKSNLDLIGRLIMEEATEYVNPNQSPPPPSTKSNDDIPF